MTIINAFQLMMSYVRARQVLSEMVSIDAKAYSQRSTARLHTAGSK